MAAKKPTKSTAVESADTVELIATDKGYHSNEGRVIKPGETFHLPRETAKRGASWFTAADPKVQEELDAEKADEAKKAKAPVKKAEKPEAPKPEAEDDELA